MIFVALAVVWAVVLIPKALRHHDDVARTRSVDEVSDSARVLARREPVSATQAELVAGPSSSAPAPESAVPAPREATGPTPLTAPRPVVPLQRPRAQVAARRRAAAAAARRRRRVLMVLLLSDLAVVGLTLTGVLAAWAPAVPGGLTVAYLVLCRVLVRRERTRSESERSAYGATASADNLAPEADLAVEADVPVTEGADTSVFDAAVLREAVVTADGGSLWDPLPVTLPTYVTAPRAPRSVRTIDLRHETVASSGHDATDSAMVAEVEAAESASGVLEQELRPVRRAVGD